jgi:hypothetical protein
VAVLFDPTHHGNTRIRNTIETAAQKAGVVILPMPMLQTSSWRPSFHWDVGQPTLIASVA